MIKQNRIYVCIYETNRTNKTQNDIKQKMKKWIFCLVAFSIIGVKTLVFGG